MCDDAEVLARGCGHLYDLDIRRCRNAIQNGTTCPPQQRTRVHYPQEDHDGKCKHAKGNLLLILPGVSLYQVVVSGRKLTRSSRFARQCWTALTMGWAGEWVVRSLDDGRRGMGDGEDGSHALMP
ncbi:hypothetical protein ONS96_002637 [Cadophora gregata f. sp. sojae]|nr:hypothetical protein ONS96_002637 [Cadophora gregata f. sp. sojae]